MTLTTEQMDALFDSLVKQAKRSNEIRQEIQNENKRRISNGSAHQLNLQRLPEIKIQIPIQLDQ